MATTKQDTKATQNGKADDEKAATQAAQQAEANGGPVTFEFDGYTYEITPGTPSWKTMRHLALWVDGNDIGLVRALLDCIGEEQFDLASERHTIEEMPDFWFALQKAAGGN